LKEKMTVFCDPKQSQEACLEAYHAAKAEAWDAAWGSTDAIVHTVTHSPFVWICLAGFLFFLWMAWSQRKEEVKKPIIHTLCGIMMLSFPLVMGSTGPMV
jgi:hypothetical protein